VQPLTEEAPPEREPGALARLFARADVWLRMRMGPAAVALPTIVFVLCWLYLNAFAGSTWPLGESRFPAYLGPSPEATAGLAVVCAIVWIGRKPHAALFFVLAGVLLVARLLATADALVVAALDRPFHPGRDLSLVWELFILLDDTIDRLTLVGWMAASAIVFGLLLFFVKQAFAIARNYFVERTHRLLFAATAGVLALLSLALGGPYQRSPIAAALAGPDAEESEDVAARASAVGALVRAAPHGLERLEGHDVYVIHVPSYGHALLDDPAYRAQMQPVWEETAAALSDDGWSMRSHLLDAPARRGMAWLSHATLATGVRVADQPSFDALLATEPETLAQLFRDAGHRTVRVLPGAARDRPERELPGFGNRYRAWELGYLGPPYGRVAVPDQFALWRVWEREAEPSDAGVLADVVLCAAEPPYAQHPPYVEDWSTIGTGELYRTLEPVRFETEWSRLDEASGPMLATLAHELRVVRGYLVDQLPDAGAPQPRRRGRRGRRAAPEPLVIVVGSHQPPGPLVDDDAGDAVIVHAISRDDELLAAFAERGFTEGPVPGAPPPYDGMETFMPWLVDAFSEAEEAAADAEPDASAPGRQRE
jgi:hypothetical protein